MWRGWLSKITTQTRHIIFKERIIDLILLHHKTELFKVLNANNVNYIYSVHILSNFCTQCFFYPLFLFFDAKTISLDISVTYIKNKICSIFLFPAVLFQHEYIEGFAGGRWGECGSKSLSSFSPPVQEAQGDLNPWTGATEGAKETQGDRWGGCRLQNSVNSDCGSQRNFLCCI